MKFSTSTTKHLGHYVYALIDPRDKSIFYVGKASSNNRAFDHFRVKGEEQKHSRIQEIRDAKLEPEVEILRYGLDSVKACLDVEAAVIDAIGLENLTNKIRGHGIDRGRQTSSEVERLHGSKPVAVEAILEPLMLFFINQSYTPTKNESELYDCVRQFWFGVSEKNRNPLQSTGKLPYPIALGVVGSVVVRAYSVAAWFPAGTTMSSRSENNPENRWEFVGKPLQNHSLLGRRLTKDGLDLQANQQGYTYIGSFEKL
jgi:hypothetical protein